MCKLIGRRRVWKQREQLGIVPIFGVRNKYQSGMNYMVRARGMERSDQKILRSKAP